MKLIGYAIFLYPILYVVSVYYEALAYRARNESRSLPAQGYNKHQKYMFLGRFGPLFGMPIIGLSLDTGVSTATLILVISIGHFMGASGYLMNGARFKRPSSRGLLWALGVIFHVLGLHILFILSSFHFEYRATLLLCSGVVNGLGSFIVIYFVEHDIAQEIDKNTSQDMYLMHQSIRAYVHFFSGVSFLLLGLSIYE